MMRCTRIYWLLAENHRRASAQAQMNWTNVKIIFLREVRDQLRDRRTLFMIAVLPVVLYPLLGMSMVQVTQFVRDQSTRILVVGA